MPARDAAAAKSQSADPTPAPTLAQMQLAAMAPLGAMAPVALRLYQDTMMEMSDFVLMRLKKDAQTSRALMGCTTLADVSKVQADALHEAFADYAKEATRLAGIATRNAEEHHDLPV